MTAQPVAVPPTPPEVEASASWTARLRRRLLQDLPPEKALPDEQPEYVASWIYVFGVATLAALIVVVASGLLLALKGPQW